ncbi:MAG: tRNA glutamyl-Q(34) synthetase GluQRS [Gammaproteobacteria bacterium]|nr:tRNA glutamyl-Q(34) synthetase GluQRS [Gammaproteobacteria bacterium]
MSYRGRFAPTPSGPLHLGSLLTALASYLQAKSAGGIWLLRVDDLDRPRCPPGADAEILRQLDGHGLHWDEPPRYQTRHIAEYLAALERLRAQGLLYACGCTRAELAASSRAGPDGPVYAGTCRGTAQPIAHPAWRLRVPDRELCFDDGWQGRQCRRLADEVGDFVLRRADGPIAYQLACAVDEGAQGITEVVRGADLLGSTFRPLWVQGLLRLPQAAYRHLPVLLDAQGRKLSKQNHAAPAEVSRAPENLMRCLSLLGQEPPSALRGERVSSILAWGIRHWDAARVPAQFALAP